MDNPILQRIRDCSYQDTLVMLFLRALKEIVPEAQAEVLYSVFGGLYIETPGSELSADEIRQIADAMQVLVDRDAKTERISLKRDDAILFMNEHGRPLLVDIMIELERDQEVVISGLDGYYDVFQNELLESVGSIKVEELLKYRDGILLKLPEYEYHAGFHGASGRILYDSLMLQRKYNEMLGIKFVDDLNRVVESPDLKDTVLLSEALHQKRIVEVVKEIVDKKRRIILIVGPSSSGKTTFARRLGLQLRVEGKHPIYISTDDYFVERTETPIGADGKPNFEGIEAIDVNLFVSQMDALLAGEEVDIPVFDFIKGSKIFGKRKTRISEDDPIIIEGIHAFNPKLIGRLDPETEYKIYISPLSSLNLTMHNRVPATDTRLLRRMVRDARTRGNLAEDTIRNWPKVRAGEEENIFPYSGEADVVFNTIHVYEIAVLKKHAMPLLEAVPEDQPEYLEARRLMNVLRFVHAMDDESLIERTSIIREFIGGSIFEI